MKWLLLITLSLYSFIVQSAPCALTNVGEQRGTYILPRFYVSTSKSIIKALINMHSFEIQLSPIG